MANLFTLTRRHLAPVLKLSFQAQLQGQLEVCGSGTEYFQHIPRRIQNYQNHTYAQFHTSSRCSDIFSVQDEEDFKTKVLESKKAVIVDFHAKWCGPCKVLMPRLEKAIAATKEAVDLAKVDIDELPDLAMEYNVQAVPSVIAMKNGKVVDKFVGLKDDDQIGTFITAAGKK